MLRFLIAPRSDTERTERLLSVRVRDINVADWKEGESILKNEARTCLCSRLEESEVLPSRDDAAGVTCVIYTGDGGTECSFALAHQNALSRVLHHDLRPGAGQARYRGGPLGPTTLLSKPLAHRCLVSKDSAPGRGLHQRGMRTKGLASR